MKGKTLKYIILLATVSIAGIFFTQFVFIRSSYKLSETQFNESASVALKEVAWQVMVATGTTAHFDSITPVEMISGNTYLVNVGVVIDKELLKFHLIEQLKKHELYYDFEFAIFNSTEEQMEDATLVTASSEELPSEYSFPMNDAYINYFGIHFPDRSAYFNTRLSIWYFLTALLVIVISFFGYTLAVIIRQRQLSEIQKNFINNLTHELKTPISSIALSAKVLNDKKIIESPKRLFEYARIVQEQNMRLSKNVEKVLNLASLEKTRIHLNTEKINMQEFLVEVTEMFKISDYGRTATLTVDAGNLNKNIIGDKFHFANLITNILENAVKYCEAKPEIQILVKQDKRGVVLSFVDNGIGISKEHRKKIFRKFYRVPTGNVHNVKGFGLGLDYVYKIVKAHHWKIFVDENTGGGSIFVITIPN